MMIFPIVLFLPSLIVVPNNATFHPSCHGWYVRRNHVDPRKLREVQQHHPQGETMTLGIAVQSRIDDIVAQWVREGKMFTAFEVSLAVKEEGVRERHRNMREYVHQSIFRAGVARGDYTRTLMDVGAPEQAWVYHPAGSNPYEYEPLDRSGFAKPRGQRDSVPSGVRNPALLK